MSRGDVPFPKSTVSCVEKPSSSRLDGGVETSVMAVTSESDGTDTSAFDDANASLAEASELEDGTDTPASDDAGASLAEAAELRLRVTGIVPA